MFDNTVTNVINPADITNIKYLDTNTDTYRFNLDNNTDITDIDVNIIDLINDTNIVRSSTVFDVNNLTISNNSLLTTLNGLDGVTTHLRRLISLIEMIIGTVTGSNTYTFTDGNNT